MRREGRRPGVLFAEAACCERRRAARLGEECSFGGGAAKPGTKGLFSGCMSSSARLYHSAPSSIHPSGSTRAGLAVDVVVEEDELVPGVDPGTDPVALLASLVEEDELAPGVAPGTDPVALVASPAATASVEPSSPIAAAFALRPSRLNCREVGATVAGAFSCRGCELELCA
eukprot:g19595.t1